MKITKRLTSLVLILAFAFTSLCTFTVSAAFSDVDETNAYYEAISALVDDGTINGYEDGTFKPENTITRAEFSKLLAIKTAPSAQTFTSKTTAFPDVAEDHWANSYIAYAASVGAVNGYPDGTFKPENPVTYGEAVKMIICGMGYATAVDTTLTPWHKGYIDLAIQINLTKNAMSLGDNPANRGIVAQLIYNIAYTKVIEQGVNGQWGVSDDSNKTYGDNKDNVQTAEGILLGVTDYSLNGAAVGRNRVQIGNNIYELSGNLNVETLKTFIGQQVEFAYNKSTVTRVVKRTGYNSEITIEPWQIADVTNNYIEYYVNQAAYDKDDATKISFANNMYVIYNTQIVLPTDITAFDIASSLDVKTGSIKLTSNDGNEKTAELATVESYTTYFANTPSTTNGVTTIYDRVNASNNISIDEDDAEGRVTKVTSNGGTANSSTLTAITNKSVVSVAVPYGKTDGTSVIISTATVTGEVTELSDDFENIVIASKNYEVSPYYEALVAANTKPDAEFLFATGDSGKFYLDHLGRIVYFEKNESADPYGLIVQYAYGNGLNESDRIQIMTASGKTTVFTLKSTLKVDGSSKSSEEAIEYLKSKAAKKDGTSMLILPVKYNASGTLISSIDTLADMYSGKFTFSKTGYTFKGVDGTSGQFTAANSGTNKATVYVIPTTLGDIDNYKQYSPSSVEEGTYNEVYAYEPAGTTNAKVVLCFLTGTQTTDAKIYAGTPVYMIESIATGTEDGKSATIVYCRNLSSAVSGDAVKKYSTDSDMMAKLNELKMGDMVKFAEESTGEIVNMKTVYVTDSTAGERRLTAETADADGVDVAGHKIFADSSDLAKYYQVILGTVYSIDSDNNTLNYVPTFIDDVTDANNAPAYEGLTLSANTVYTTIDKVGQKDAYISKAISDIRGYRDFYDADGNPVEPEKGSEVLILIMNKEVKAVYIINDNYR